jgi:iron complex transport system substrate-binding protein
VLKKGMRQIVFMSFFLFAFTSLSAKEVKIVSLDPSLTEILFAAGLGKNIVGVTKHCNFPKETKSIDKLGDYNNPNIEKILYKQASHILVLESGRPWLEKDTRLSKVKRLSFPATTLDDYPNLLQSLKKEFPEAKIDELLKDYRRQKKSIGEIHTNKTGLILIGESPLVLAGKSSFLSQALELCGFSNLSNSEKAWPTVSRESLLLSMTPLFIRIKMTEQQSWQEQNLYKDAQKIDLLGDHYFRLGPRFLPSIKKLCHKLTKL